MVDLNKFSSIGTATSIMTVYGLDGETPLQGKDGGVTTIELYSVDSKEYREAIQKQSRKLLKRKGFRVSSLEFQSDEEQEARRSELTASVTVSWKGFELDGKDFPCTLENAKTLYDKFPFIREQVEFFISERKNFLGNS